MSGDAAWVTTTTILQELKTYDSNPAWEHLVARFRGPIEHFAQKVGVRAADRQDVAQNTLMEFAEAYRRGKYDREKGRLSNWLFGIAYRQALAQRRRDAHDPPPGASELTAEQLSDAITVNAIWNQVWDRCMLERGVEQARGEFSAETFAAFEMVVIDDRAVADAAERLGVPVKTVYNAKHRVLKRVRELLEELGEVEAD